MPQINLLQPRKPDSREFWMGFISWSIKILLVGIAALAAYYGFLIYKIHQQNSNIINLSDQIQTQTKALNQISGRDELYTRQQQLKQLLTLVSSHPYWSGLLPALAKDTLKNANFLSFQAQGDGSLTLSVTVPSIQDLDKFLQVFDLPEFNQNFYNIKIGSLGKSQVGNQLLTQFNVNMNYNPALLLPPASIPAAGQ